MGGTLKFIWPARPKGWTFGNKAFHNRFEITFGSIRLMILMVQKLRKLIFFISVHEFQSWVK